MCDGFLFMNKEQLQKIIQEMKERLKSNDKEVPIIASLILDKNDPFSLVLYSTNTVEKANNPLLHAEINVINDALKLTNSKYLKDSILIVSLEPCLMCLGAILKVGIKEIYYILDDEKDGALSHYHAFVDDKLKITRLHDDDFKEIMNDFFKRIRK